MELNNVARVEPPNNGHVWDQDKISSNETVGVAMMIIIMQLLFQTVQIN